MGVYAGSTPVEELSLQAVRAIDNAAIKEAETMLVKTFEFLMIFLLVIDFYTKKIPFEILQVNN